MKKLPKSVNVKGTKYKIKYVSKITHDGEDCAGLCDYNGKILLIKKQSVEEMVKSVLHEVQHATLFEIRMSCNDGWVSPIVEEMIVDNIADVLFDLLFKK